MADLQTNYLDDILAQSMNGKRKYRITRADGTFEEVTLEDVSEYEQVGSNFGAGDINKTNQAVNEKFDSGDVVDPMLTTEPGFAADAYQTKLQFSEQNKNLEKQVIYRDVNFDNYTITVNDNLILNASSTPAYVPPTVSGYTLIAVSVLNVNGENNVPCIIAPRISQKQLVLRNTSTTAVTKLTYLRLRHIYIKN